MPYSPIKIANEILRLAAEKTPARFITPLQLIKLVYIAHGWSLHFWPQRPLLNEPAQAWQYGPVIPTLYHSIKQFGSQPITNPVFGDTDPQELSEDSKKLISAVYNSYGHLSGVQLSSLTHQPGTPWSNAWNLIGKNAIISNDDIKAHYDLLAEKRKNGKAS